MIAKKYSIVIPAYNEEAAIAEAVKRTLESNPEAELILVDDGSTDGTWPIMEELSDRKDVSVFRHAENKGKAFALKTGYSRASTDTIVTIDADLTYQPESIPRLVNEFEQGFDMVIGTRFKNGFPKNASFLKSLANVSGSLLASAILRRRITDLSSGLRVINKKVAFLDVKATNLEYEAELTSRVITNRMKYAEVPISVERRVGSSKLKFVQNCYLFMKAVIIGKYS
ncbi:MAG: glycosyltransferase family 2 protein [Candidatus Aminicenantes bacterium]|jgi:glycosyltransferase involved in cell wall biosynthesis